MLEVLALNDLVSRPRAEDALELKGKSVSPVCTRHHSMLTLGWIPVSRRFWAMNTLR